MCFIECLDYYLYPSKDALLNEMSMIIESIIRMAISFMRIPCDN